MPGMPDPCLDPVAVSELRAALRATAIALSDAMRRRSVLATIAREQWRGGRRISFDEALARLDRETARVALTLDRLARRLATLPTDLCSTPVPAGRRFGRP